MFQSVLIANRGEIAVRIAQTLRRLGIRSVAVCSIPDRQSLAVRTADKHVLLEGYSAAETYLDIDAVIAAAKATACEAIHPGYGFLSESAEFAERCSAANLIFIGPPAAVLSGVGDKGAARRLAVENGVPVVPGWDGADDDATLREQARRIGLPVMIKARGGGGGRGMREVFAEDELPEAITSARREAESAFGKPGLLVEKLVNGAHHVEVQILADSSGNIVHLGERDCSVQRRHQKLIEETPSPVVDDLLRSELTGAAIRLARAIGYVNAGTFEFLVGERGADGRRPFYFLEVNPRLQVEHPITEAVTEFDLVELQLRIAAGEHLPFAQHEIAFTGHAIECRINAEDPQAGFAPSTGRLAKCESWADRFDRGFADGDTVPPQYDSLLGKLVVTAPDRQIAIESMLTELDAITVRPVRTTAPLQAAILRNAEFAAGEASIDWLERELPRLLAASILPVEWWAAAAAIAAHEEWGTDRVGRFGRAGWIGAARPSLCLDDGAVRREVALLKQSSHSGIVRVEGEDVDYRISDVGIHVREMLFSASRIGQRSVLLTSAADGHPVDRRLRLVAPRPLARKARQVTDGAMAITAPLAGTIANVAVMEGDPIHAGQVLILLEAMKMEHRIMAPADGVVKTVHVASGTVVREGELLVELG